MQWTLVTGASRNLGKALAIQLAKSGHNIVVHYKSNAKEASIVAETCRQHGVKAETIQGDLSCATSTSDFIKRYSTKFPNTRVLINNVGNYHIGSALNTTPEQWISLFHTNLHAPFALSRSLTPSLIKNQGHIINIGVVGNTKGVNSTYCPAYMIGKHALWGLTQSLAKELAPQSVNVNMISPGHLEHSVDLAKDLNTLPSGRPVHPDEIASVLHFLLDEKNQQITGQNIEVAGGFAL
ncbi:3-oxoacyl-[acyl-carrier-protein] reductase FabG [Chlamydiales bacterium SCGC AG-110-M15]|nr:3-oxoacyl-[acyl-carrier-protein] reductase FabG [Chlamydiales bacterium SCGC AG-110-M15]